MSQETTTIQCPNCGTEINVSDVLRHQVEEQLTEQYEAQFATRQKLMDAARRDLRRQQEALKEREEEQQQAVATAIADGLKKEREKLQKQLREQAKQESAEALKALQEELRQKSDQLKELNKAKADVERIRREKDELKGSLEVEFQKRMTQEISAQAQKIRKAEQDKVQLTVAEREKVIQQLREQLREAQRQAEQGSMQLQGEVQEVAIEEWLRQQYPLDTIEEIRKGERGADCLQTVHARHRQNCGTIYYESKRTKAFQPAWLEKFRQDIRNRGADVGVLVTQAMPSDMERMGLREGVWICSFEEFHGLSLVLRETMIRIAEAAAVHENRGEKMGLLYDYLTGHEFRQQVEAIVEGFSQMQQDLSRERNAMQRIWRQREKQLEKVLLSTAQMYGSIRGIAGSAMRSLPLLELPGAEQDAAMESAEE